MGSLSIGRLVVFLYLLGTYNINVNTISGTQSRSESSNLSLPTKVTYKFFEFRNIFIAYIDEGKQVTYFILSWGSSEISNLRVTGQSLTKLSKNSGKHAKFGFLKF